MRKTADAAIIRYYYEHFSPWRQKLGFERGIAVQKALLQVQANPEERLYQDAGLNFSKDYEKIDRVILFEMEKKRLLLTDLIMMRATLGTERGRNLI